MLSAFDIQVAARTLAQEARGEPAEGQKAVAWVMRNRITDGRWGKNLASVCLWKGQFSGWYMPRDPNFAYACGLSDADPVCVKMGHIIGGVMAAPAIEDPVKGATHYFATSIPDPAWVKDATPCGQIGHHKFFKGVK